MTTDATVEVTPNRPWPVPVPIEVHYDVSNWLSWEAQLLDAGRYREWLELLDPAVQYRMPVRVTTARHAHGSAPLGDMAHFDEDLYSLTKRVERLEGQHAWTEDPPSRTRRFVTNVTVAAGGAEVVEPSGGSVEVLSNQLLFRSRGDDRAADFVSVGRTDLLVATCSGWRLRRRDLVLDEAVLRTQNLAIFL